MDRLLARLQRIRINPKGTHPTNEKAPQPVKVLREYFRDGMMSDHLDRLDEMFKHYTDVVGTVDTKGREKIMNIDRLPRSNREEPQLFAKVDDQEGELCNDCT